MIEFQDSKPGVSMEDMERLFERFYRVEGSRNRSSGGAGLGLTISKNIVDAHEGFISAHPSLLGGLLIRIRIPIFEGLQ
jgi:two-component system sensor histidine kinase BaeS